MTDQSPSEVRAALRELLDEPGVLRVYIPRKGWLSLELGTDYGNGDGFRRLSPSMRARAAEALSESPASPQGDDMQGEKPSPLACQTPNCSRRGIPTRVGVCPACAVNTKRLPDNPVAALMALPSPASPGTGGWQAIETAPKDVHVLVWWPYWSLTPVVARLSTAFNRWESEVALESGDAPVLPTHWMPLPLPPQEQERDR